jgi:hypothetical protein
LHFYERNPAGRGLYFDGYPESKSEIVRYKVELRYLNLVVETKKTPLPPLEDLAEAITILLAAGLHHDKEPRKELEKVLPTEGITKDWIPDQRGPARRNTH